MVVAKSETVSHHNTHHNGLRIACMIPTKISEWKNYTKIVLFIELVAPLQLDFKNLFNEVMKRYGGCITH